MRFEIPGKSNKKTTKVAKMPPPRRKAERVDHKWRLCTDWYMADAIEDALDASPVGTRVTVCTWTAAASYLRRLGAHPRRGVTTIYMDHSNTARDAEVMREAEALGAVHLRHVHAKCAVVGDYVIVSSSNLSRCRGAELTEMFLCAVTARWLEEMLAAELPENKASMNDVRRGAGL